MSIIYFSKLRLGRENGIENWKIIIGRKTKLVETKKEELADHFWSDVKKEKMAS